LLRGITADLLGGLLLNRKPILPRNNGFYFLSAFRAST